METFDYDSYQVYLKDRIEREKQLGSPINFSYLADSIKVQRSYLSHVLNGRAHLNADQLFEIAHALKLGQDEADYLLLLLEIERCSSNRRKVLLMQRRDGLRKSQMTSRKHMTPKSSRLDKEFLAEYYSNRLCSLVHMYLTIDEFRRDPQPLVKKLNISHHQLADVLKVLEKAKVIGIGANGEIQLKMDSVHLDESSPFRAAHATQFRLHALNQLQEKQSEADYFYTATFSANADTLLKVKKKFLQFLKEATKDISITKAKQVYHMNFDLFGM
ncbi:MAG: TIGR02147 family protein [Oligoflexales bacterium]